MKLFNAIIKNPREVQFESQDKSEKVYFILRRHPITNIKWIAFSIVLTILPLLAMVYMMNIVSDPFKYFPMEYQIIAIIIWYLVTLLFAFESFLIWYFNIYIITDKRVIDIDFIGLWSKRVSEAALDKVEDVTYDTTGMGHIIFDYGNITMQTAAEQREFEFDAVPHPGLVHDKLTDLVRDYIVKRKGK